MPSFTTDGTAPSPKFVSGTGGGNYPKAADLYGALVMLTPVQVETVPGFEGKGTAERLTADTVVLDGDFQGEFPSMWWGQSPIVKAGKEALRRGDGSIILGRLFRFPQSGNKDKFPTREALEKAIASWRPGKPEIRYAWALEKFSDEDQALAQSYLQGDLTLSQPDSDEDEDDPFED